MKQLALILIFAASGALADTLTPYVVENANAIPAPLTETPGDAVRGEALMLGAGCSACHQKDLNGISARMTEGEMRLMLVAPSIRTPDTPMPGYYQVGVYGEAPDELVGRTRLSAQEIEDIIAYLAAL